jgi:hypothetical protein
MYIHGISIEFLVNSGHYIEVVLKGSSPLTLAVFDVSIQRSEHSLAEDLLDSLNISPFSKGQMVDLVRKVDGSEFIVIEDFVQSSRKSVTRNVEVAWDFVDEEVSLDVTTFFVREGFASPFVVEVLRIVKVTLFLVLDDFYDFSVDIRGTLTRKSHLNYTSFEVLLVSAHHVLGI